MWPIICISAVLISFIWLGVYEDVRETSNSGPSPIINIKKERETEEETKEILRKLEKDSVCLQKLKLINLLNQTCAEPLPACITPEIKRKKLQKENKSIMEKNVIVMMQKCNVPNSYLAKYNLIFPIIAFLPFFAFCFWKGNVFMIFIIA